MSKRQKVNASSSSSEVDFVRLCEDVVQRIEEVLQRGQVLILRQCKLLASRLSAKIAQFREALEGCGSYKLAFVPLLAALHRYYEKAEVLVEQCAQEDWCAAAVFIYYNRGIFSYILNHINTVGKKILEIAKNYQAADSTTMPNVFSLDVNEYFLGGHKDHAELSKRLEAVASEGSNSSFKIFGFLLAQQVSLKQQHLARYLLKKDNVFYPKVFKGVNGVKRKLWEKEKESAET